MPTRLLWLLLLLVLNREENQTKEPHDKPTTTRATCRGRPARRRKYTPYIPLIPWVLILMFSMAYKPDGKIERTTNIPHRTAPHLFRVLSVHVPDGERRGDDEGPPGGRREGHPGLQAEPDVVEPPEVFLERHVPARVFLGERVAVLRVSDERTREDNKNTDRA